MFYYFKQDLAFAANFKDGDFGGMTEGRGIGNRRDEAG
jgi:hypothetical protein